MNRASLSALLAACTLGAASWATPAAAADVDVGVSIRISQPGVYGRIDIGRFPQPQIIVSQPVLVHRPPAARHRPAVQPVYLWVPPGHRQNWRKHCREYGACGVPVYFVRHDWYDREVRRNRGRDDDRRGRDGRRDRHDERDHDRGHDRDHRGHDHGPGRGRGKHD
jgi:hypothetical protein